MQYQHYLHIPTSLRNTDRTCGRYLCPTPPGTPRAVVQDCVQLDFDSIQEWRHHNLSRQPMPVLGHSHSEGSEGAACAPLCAPGPATGHHQEEPGSIHSSCLLQLFTDTDKSPLSLFSKERVPHHLCDSLLDFASSSTTFFTEKHNSSVGHSSLWNHNTKYSLSSRNIFSN